jgi:kynureninase
MLWANIALALLKLVNAIMGAVNREKWIQAGMDAEIAKASAAVLAKTEYAKKLREKIDAMDDATIDAALRDLEPK